MAEAEGSSPLLLPPPPPPPLGMAEVEAPTAAETDKKQFSCAGGGVMDVERSRFPYCVVWTPIPVLTTPKSWTSLVAQWLRICLPVQGTQVRSLVLEDTTCRGATKPLRHNY
ncbi:transmembrane protein 222-like isoform X1 [Physeter macrocephalus]|uniref:Transmembrane protein 222-like isoform X1 n=1 Tax=Physeter macrocephalus TaxID=9755 RepID=A0A9W2WJP9_PHYMC|nr:transmembrane protein 222-like isoform X1 [Physeter catodon]